MPENIDFLAGVRPSYPEVLLDDAMENLATFFDYAVNDYGAEGDELAGLLAMSETGKAFGCGDPRYICGMSGFELFVALDRENGYAGGRLPEPTARFDRTPEYWVGWAVAYVQWRLGISFEALFQVAPYSRLHELYAVAHEADCDWLALRLAGWMKTAYGPTRLAASRLRLGLSQRDLARQSGVSLRSIQMYEQRNKDINKAQAQTLQSLARTLNVGVEQLLEPGVLSVKLPSEFAA